MRKQILLCAAAFAAMTMTAAQAATFHGFLYSKLELIGTKSEGPGYFLQTFDGRDIAIRKQVMLWRADPALEPYVGKKVTIEGELAGDAIEYQSVKPYAPSFDSLKH